MTTEKDSLLKIAHRFEHGVVTVLVATVGLITLLAMARLLYSLYDSVFISWDIKNTNTLPLLFGMVMTVLIAIELGNSILRHIRDHSTILQAREVVLIGMMAVVRKVMIIDMSQTSALHLGALGVVAVSLAIAYWLMRENNESPG